MRTSQRTLKEISTLITKGTTPTTMGRPFVKEGINFIKAEALNSDTSLERSGFAFIDEETHRLLQRSILEENDVLVTIAGANTGKCGFVREIDLPANTNQAVGIVRINHESADPRFVYYFFKQKRIFDYIQTLSAQAAQPNLNLTSLGKIRISLPPRCIQTRIASILSAYDNLIENNRRRIQLLEQAARLLYKEWFVRLRFPGHEYVKVKDRVPEGWEKASVSSFCIVGRGGSPRPIQDYLGGTVPWFKIGDATASQSPFVFSTNEQIIEDGVRKSVLLPPQELILSNSATCGIPYFTGISGCIHDGWLYFKKLQRISKWFLYCGLFVKQHEILMGIGEGATQKNLNTNYIGRLALLLPKNDALLRSFDDFVHPLFDQIFSLAQQNRQLTQARNLLLPRLMSGEIKIG